MSATADRLVDHCQLITKGTTPTSVGLSFIDQGVPFLRVGNVSRGNVNYMANTLFIDSHANSVLRRSQILPGDVLLSIAGTIGRAGVVPDCAPAMNCNQALAIIRTRESIHRQYLRHWLESRQAQAQMAGATVTGTIQNLSLTQVGELRIPLPPLPEQRRIATILDQADALRAKRREALAQLHSLTQSIFIEMFGSYRTDGIPWPIRPVEDIAVEMTIGLVRSAAEFGLDFEVPYVRMNAIGQRGEFLPNLVLRTSVNEGEFERYELRPGDLLFNTRNSRELVGKTALFRESGRYVFNNNLMRIRFRDGVHPEYVAAAFQTPYIQQELEIRKAGTTSVFAIYARDLKTVPIPVPPLSLQQTFATRIQAVDSLKATHRAALAELDALFASLQHRAFARQLS